MQSSCPGNLHLCIFKFWVLNSTVFRRKKKKKGNVRSNCGPGLGGFLGDVWCFSERNEVLWESKCFPTIIVLAAITAPLPQPKQGCGWQVLLSPEVHHNGEQSWALKRCSSPLQRNGAGLQPTGWSRGLGSGVIPSCRHSHPARAGQRRVRYAFGYHSTLLVTVPPWPPINSLLQPQIN